MQVPTVRTKVRRKPSPELREALPKVGHLVAAAEEGPTHPALDCYHRVRPSPWPSEPVCRRGKSPDRRLMGLRDWFFAAAAAAAAGGCQ